MKRKYYNYTTCDRIIFIQPHTTYWTNINSVFLSTFQASFRYQEILLLQDTYTETGRINRNTLYLLLKIGVMKAAGSPQMGPVSWKLHIFHLNYHIPFSLLPLLSFTWSTIFSQVNSFFLLLLFHAHLRHKSTASVSKVDVDSNTTHIAVAWTHAKLFPSSSSSFVVRSFSLTVWMCLAEFFFVHFAISQRRYLTAIYIHSVFLWVSPSFVVRKKSCGRKVLKLKVLPL